MPSRRETTRDAALLLRPNRSSFFSSRIGPLGPPRWSDGPLATLEYRARYFSTDWRPARSPKPRRERGLGRASVVIAA